MTGESASLISLDGRIALVTGGSRGIGRAISMVLADAGAQVIVNYRSGEAEARATLEQILDRGDRASLAPFDVCDPGAVNKALSTIQEEHAQVDFLINNAGITRDGLIGRMKDSDWDEVISTNLSGAFHLCRSVGKTMIRQRHGRIINVASTAGESGNAGQVNYTAAKAGLIGLTKALARELAPRNILVNAVSPGLIAGGMTEDLNEQQVQTIQSHVPLRRMGSQEDVAHAVLFLCSSLSRYVTGQVIRVNGGLYM